MPDCGDPGLVYGLVQRRIVSVALEFSWAWTIKSSFCGSWNPIPHSWARATNYLLVVNQTHPRCMQVSLPYHTTTTTIWGARPGSTALAFA